jgi:phage shock protein PspC (stress-responsive transcriptional regulator)
MIYSLIFYSLMLALFFVGPALSAIAIRRSLPIRWQLVLLSICIFYGIFPFLLAWGGASLAEHFACQVETIIYHCPNPRWLGEIITWMTFAPWLAIFVTIPSAVLSFIGLLISLMLKINTSRTEVNTSGRPTVAFYRSRRHKVISGVCAAIAQQRRLPLQAVRIVTVILAVVIPGVLLLYLWFWLAFPLEPTIESI